MAKHSPNVFPPLMVNMAKAGEIGGFLDSVLLQIAENYEAEVRLRGKVKAAMTYPVVVFVIAIVSVIGMMLFIVPTFTKLFTTLGGKLPLPTSGARRHVRRFEDVLSRFCWCYSSLGCLPGAGYGTPSGCATSLTR